MGESETLVTESMSFVRVAVASWSYMPLDNFYHFLQVFVCLLMIVEAISQLLECLEEAIEIHLIVITPPYDVLVYYVVMGLQDMAVRQTRVF